MFTEINDIVKKLKKELMLKYKKKYCQRTEYMFCIINL